MKKNGLLQTFFYDFLKIQMTNYGSFEEMTRGSQEPVIAHLDQSCFQ
jgi:hypothetical protein